MVVWLDSNINELNAKFESSLAPLRNIADETTMFHDPDQFIDFIARPRPEKLFVILSDDFAGPLLPRLHKINQVDSVYVFSDKQSHDNIRKQEWSKFRGATNQIEVLRNFLKHRSRQCENNLVSTSLLSSTNVTNTGLDELDQSFMYSQILKEILLDIEYNGNAKKEFIKLCREQYSKDVEELKIIAEFNDNYLQPSPTEWTGGKNSPIWWYTRESFLYLMLNKAIRTQDIEKIIKMGFFMRDLHRHIEDVHLSTKVRESFVVYRGQSMSIVEFEKMKKNKGGLLSFNSFLSTSKDRDVARNFASKSENDRNSAIILFRMTVDPSSTFAVLDENTSHFYESEVLFSMHTIFRIGEIKQIEDELWEVDLTWTKSDDDELKRLADHIRKEIGIGTGWDRLGSLLVKMGEFNKAEEIYKTLFSLTREGDWRMMAHLNNQLGYIKQQKGEFTAAIDFYQKTLDIQKESLPPKHIDLATTYSNIGSIHDSLGDYTTALTFYRQALEIKQKSLPANDISLAKTFNNIGSVHDFLKDYPTSILFYEKALRIQQGSLISNHPSIAITYNNIGKVHREMEDYPTALSFYQKACEIFEKSLPPNHPSLATLYNNIGLVHDLMGKYRQALKFYQKTLEIKEKSLPPNHLSFATTYNNMAFVYKSMANYTTALSFYQQALDIAQRVLPRNHQDILDLKEQISIVQKRIYCS